MGTTGSMAKGALRERSGQASVEYAIVVATFLVAVAALGALWAAFDDGRVLEVAREACSHGYEGAPDVGTWQDVLLF